MGSAFFEFSIVNTGLTAAKAGLETTSHNIANSSAVGYTRQVVYQKASDALKKCNGIGMVGTGTTVYGIGQIRDVYLDKKYWQQQSTLGEYEQKATQLSMIEAIFDDLSTTGLTSQLNDFFDSLSELAISSSDNTYKTAVINNAEAILSTVKEYATNLQKQQEAVNDDIYALVQRINAIGKQITGLNKQIYNYELDGSSANDLRDQRALLIDELSKYVNIETKFYTDTAGQERLTILINGQEFVNHYDSRTLTCERRADLMHESDLPGLYDIKWEGGMDFDLTGLSGELKGLIDIRDGDSGTGDGGTYKGIPYYLDRLNEFVRTFAIAMNEGTDLNGVQLDGVTGHTQAFNTNGETGILFFSFVQDDGTINTANNIDYTKDINVFNITISQELKDNSSNMATLATADTTQASENTVVLGYASLAENKLLFREGGMYQYVNSISSTLGIDAKQANNFQSYYTDIVSTVESQRLQVSGVSLNEEIANVLKYQQLYQACAKLMSVINEVYNITVNGLGI